MLHYCDDMSSNKIDVINDNQNFDLFSHGPICYFHENVLILSRMGHEPEDLIILGYCNPLMAKGRPQRQMQPINYEWQGPVTL